MDTYFKKELTYKFQNRIFTFDVANTLFSTYAVDHGTDIFIRAIETQSKPQTILDLGCGYGPLGIMLAYKHKAAQVTMLDKDLLAIRYAQHNIQKNTIPNATAIGSVGLEAVQDRTFDLIVTNVPAKIGDEAITEEFLLKPYHQLTPQGELWLVVVNALNHLIPRMGRKHQLHMTEIRNRNGHTVYCCKNAKQSN